jgi:hypothetical protein
MKNNNQNPGAIHDFLRELNEATEAFAETLGGSSAAEVSLGGLGDFAKMVRGLHTRLNEGYDPDEGRSRIIEKFFNQWNNMVFGVFYAEELQRKNGKLTDRQFTILKSSIDEIHSYAERFGAIRH